MAVDDEDEFIRRSLDFVVEPCAALSHYLMQRNILFVMLCLTLFFRFCLTIYSARNEEMLILELSGLYRFKHERVIKTIFYAADTISLGLNIAVSLYGFHAISTNRLTRLHWFNIMLAAQLPLYALLLYLNAVFIFLMVATGLLWVQLKIVKGLLVSLLVRMSSSEGQV